MFFMRLSFVRNEDGGLTAVEETAVERLLWIPLQDNTIEIKNQWGFFGP